MGAILVFFSSYQFTLKLLFCEFSHNYIVYVKNLGVSIPLSFSSYIQAIRKFCELCVQSITSICLWLFLFINFLYKSFSMRSRLTNSHPFPKPLVPTLFLRLMNPHHTPLCLQPLQDNGELHPLTNTDLRGPTRLAPQLLDDYLYPLPTPHPSQGRWCLHALPLPSASPEGWLLTFLLVNLTPTAFWGSKLSILYRILYLWATLGLRLSPCLCV